MFFFSIFYWIKTKEFTFPFEWKEHTAVLLLSNILKSTEEWWIWVLCFFVLLSTFIVRDNKGRTNEVERSTKNPNSTFHLFPSFISLLFLGLLRLNWIKTKKRVKWEEGMVEREMREEPKWEGMVMKEWSTHSFRFGSFLTLSTSIRL